MEPTNLPAAEPAAATPAQQPIQISEGKKKIYKAATRQFIHDVENFLKRFDKAMGISNEFYVNAHTERSFAGQIWYSYKNEFQAMESELRDFYTESFNYEQTPHAAFFNPTRLQNDFFRDISDPIAASGPIDRINRTISWFSYFEHKV